MADQDDLVYIVHDYMRVDEDVLWEVVDKDLPALLPLLEKIDVKD